MALTISVISDLKRVLITYVVPIRLTNDHLFSKLKLSLMQRVKPPSGSQKYEICWIKGLGY